MNSAPRAVDAGSQESGPQAGGSNVGGTESDSRWASWGGMLGSLRKVKLPPDRTALVIVDMQYSDASRDYGLGARAKRSAKRRRGVRLLLRPG